MQNRLTIPKVEAKEHTSYRSINVNGIFGGLRGMYIEAILYSDELKATRALSTAEVASEGPSISRTLECRLILDPLNAKAIAQWLLSQVSEYEKTFGRIPAPEELQNKSQAPESNNNGNQESKSVYQ